MPAVTFIYRVGNSANYLGKYVTGYISDDHEGLDIEIHSEVLSSINKYRANKGYRPLRVHELKVGIVSVLESNLYSSRREAKIFDFYHQDGKSFLNGREISSSVKVDKDTETFGG